MTQKAYLNFLNMIEKLKCNTRHSWTSTGRQESVAEHSFRLCIMAMLLKDEMPEIDNDRLIKMCLLHDFGEAITGDIPSFYKTEEDESIEKGAINQPIAPLDEPLRGEMGSIFAEIEEQKTPESRIMRALDKLEVLIQHNEADISTWIDIEYQLNLTYGEAEANIHPYLKELRALLKHMAEEKIRQSTDM